MNLVKVRIYASKILHCPAAFRRQKSCKICHPCKVHGPDDLTSLRSYASIFNSNNWALLVIPRQEVCGWTHQYLVYNGLTAKNTVACPGFWLFLTHLKSEFSLSDKNWQMRNTFCFHTKKEPRSLVGVWNMSVYLRLYHFKVKIFKILEWQMKPPASIKQQNMEWKGALG